MTFALLEGNKIWQLWNSAGITAGIQCRLGKTSEPEKQQKYQRQELRQWHTVKMPTTLSIHVRIICILIFSPNGHQGVFRFTYVGLENISILLWNRRNSPTQGQLNPRKIRLKVAFWVTFSHSKYFFVGWDWFYIGNRLQETQPNQILRKHLLHTR